jgi:hypothetical protein
MSDQQQIEEHNEGTGFEREDWNAGTVYAFLIGLIVVCVLVFLFLRGMYAFLDARSRASQPEQNPLVISTGPLERNLPRSKVQEQIKTTFPDPRLEENERQEINQFRTGEEETLNSYGWVNQPAGVVHIPIERAMELVAQRGLPTRPQGAAPEHVATGALARPPGQSPAK